MINKNQKVADLVHFNYHILPILNRFGILLGFGDKTIEQVCQEKKINIDFFIEVINVFLFEDYFNEENLQNFEFDEIINFLKKSHDYFINIKLIEIEKKINTLILACCKSNSSKVELIKNFYLEYKNELIEHINYENQKTFPYVLNLVNKNEKNSNFSIQEYIENHTDIEAKLFDLKNLIIKYLQLPKEIDLCNEILFVLFDLEKDLQNHHKFEEKVLVPKVLKFENQL